MSSVSTKPRTSPAQVQKSRCAVDVVHTNQRLVSVDHYSQDTMHFLENNYLNHLEKDRILRHYQFRERRCEMLLNELSDNEFIANFWFTKQGVRDICTECIFFNVEEKVPNHKECSQSLQQRPWNGHGHCCPPQLLLSSGRCMDQTMMTIMMMTVMEERKSPLLGVKRGFGLKVRCSVTECWSTCLEPQQWRRGGSDRECNQVINTTSVIVHRQDYLVMSFPATLHPPPPPLCIQGGVTIVYIWLSW